MKTVERFEGIIIRVDKSKEYDLRVVFLTPYGQRMSYAIGALKVSAKLKGALQLFNLVEVEVIGTRIMSARVLSNNSMMAGDINKFYLACSICETVYKLIRGADEEAFFLTTVALAMLHPDMRNHFSCYLVFIYFYWTLLEILGYGIEETSFLQRTLWQIKTPEELDKIKIGLSEAKTTIKMLDKAYVANLDFQIPMVEHFLGVV